MCVASAAHISTTQVNRNPTIGAYASSANIESKPMTNLKFTLTDQVSDNTIQCEAEYRYGSMWLRFDGYGDAHSEDGHGWPLSIEFYDNKLQVLVWNDINKQDPITIPLEGAKESLRENEL
jgi:hypothetical protein